MPVIRFQVGRGTATGIDPSYIDVLQESEGVHYKPGDPAAYKVGGRTLFNASPIAAARNLGLLFYRLSGIITQVDTQAYAAPLNTGVFASIRTGLNSGASGFDGVVYNQQLIVTNQVDRAFVCKSDETTINLGMSQVTTAPTIALVGGALTGTFKYWITEYDSVNDIESAFGVAGGTTAATATPAGNGVNVSKPATVNASATHWRVYRTIDTGEFPVGWRVATVAIGTATYTDTTTDAALVLLTPYAIVNINGALYSRDEKQPDSFLSLAVFEGSVCGSVADTVYYSETGFPHSFPAPYAIRMDPPLGDWAYCVRLCERALYVMFPNNTYRINYLPKAGDPIFDTGVCQEEVANFGTTSARGACTFSGWGGKPVLFVASKTGPMLINSDGSDRAVSNIDWESLIPSVQLFKCTVHDNPSLFRVEMHYQSDASDESHWSALHFYYDPRRIGRQEGPFPEMAWTGPHRVPGPAVLAVNESATILSRHQTYSGSKAADGNVYLENVGTSDAANLIGAGVVNFRMRTHRAYVGGPGGPAVKGTARRLHIHKVAAGTGVYATTVTAHKEEDGTIPHSRDVDATTAGYSSAPLNENVRAIDVRIVRDDAVAMPGINDIAVEVDDVTRFGKTTRQVT
jgi:hypothetical protein